MARVLLPRQGIINPRGIIKSMRSRFKEIVFGLFNNGRNYYPSHFSANMPIYLRLIKM